MQLRVVVWKRKEAARQPIHCPLEVRVPAQSLRAVLSCGEWREVKRKEAFVSPPLPPRPPL